MGDGRAVAAVGIIAFIAFEPVIHFATSVHEHLKFLLGFGNVDADAPFSFGGDGGSEFKQLRLGGIRRVR